MTWTGRLAGERKCSMTGIFPSTRRGVSLQPNISYSRTARIGRSGVSYSTRTFDPLGTVRWVGAHRSSWRDCSQERSACNGWARSSRMTRSSVVSPDNRGQANRQAFGVRLVDKSGHRDSCPSSGGGIPLSLAIDEAPWSKPACRVPPGKCPAIRPSKSPKDPASRAPARTESGNPIDVVSWREPSGLGHPTRLHLSLESCLHKEYQDH